MFCFNHNGKAFVVFAPHKVMTTSLYAQNHLDIATMRLDSKQNGPQSRAQRWRLKLEHIGLGRWLPGLRPYYLLVRHPFSRIESLYINAMSLAQYPTPPSRGPTLSKDVRLELLRHAVRPAKDNNAKTPASAKIKQLSFQQFIKALPKIFSDADLQHRALRQSAHSQLQACYLGLGYRFARILHIERAKDQQFMTQRLGIDMAIKVNSRRENQPFKWDDEMREIVHRYYREDFVRFGYSPEAT